MIKSFCVNVPCGVEHYIVSSGLFRGKNTRKEIPKMFVRPEAEVVLFAEESFVATSGQAVVTTTRDPYKPIEGDPEE